MPPARPARDVAAGDPGGADPGNEVHKVLLRTSDVQ
jgi:hypothetical protein